MRIIFLLSAIFLITACEGGYEDFPKRYIPRLPVANMQEYVSGVNDLPLYHGFELQGGGDSVSYDSMAGRLIDAKYISKTANIENVRSFYDSTLPELGWNKISGESFVRDGEVLKVNVNRGEEGVELKITVRPS